MKPGTRVRVAIPADRLPQWNTDFAMQAQDRYGTLEIVKPITEWERLNGDTGRALVRFDDPFPSWSGANVTHFHFDLTEIEVINGPE